MNLQFEERMCETPIVAKLQHRILNRLQKPSFFFNYFHSKIFFPSSSIFVLLFKNVLAQSNAYANIRIIACLLFLFFE